MKKARIEIRLEECKKNELKVIATDNGIGLTKLLEIAIDNLLYDYSDKNIKLDRKSEIIKHMMDINDVASQMKGDLVEELLTQLGELECLI